ARGPEDVGPLPVALGGAPQVAGHPLPGDAGQLREGPDEEAALDPLGVGVLGGEEAAVGVAQLAQQEVGGAAGHPPRGSGWGGEGAAPGGGAQAAEEGGGGAAPPPPVAVLAGALPGVGVQ